jgi:hypothetical protein
MKPFTDLLRDIRRGQVVQIATDKLAEVVRAVDRTGGVGTLTITLKIKPSKHGGNEKTIEAHVSAKAPVDPVAPAVFFSDDEGDLHRNDPKQSEMPFEQVAPRSKVAV